MWVRHQDNVAVFDNVLKGMIFCSKVGLRMCDLAFFRSDMNNLKQIALEILELFRRFALGRIEYLGCDFKLWRFGGLEHITLGGSATPPKFHNTR